MTHVLAVTGMSCSHCAEAVASAVGALSGVTGVAVDVDAGTVRVEGDCDRAGVLAAIAAAGYEVAAAA